MYRRPKFLEILLEIRREMALEADYDVDLFAENARTGIHTSRNGKPLMSLETAHGEAENVELGKFRNEIRKN